MITPTQHEKAEWSRLAQAAYTAGLSATGHAYSAAASLPKDARITTAEFDRLMNLYRKWLVAGFNVRMTELARRA